jgi:hypothetical protein
MTAYVLGQAERSVISGSSWQRTPDVLRIAFRGQARSPPPGLRVHSTRAAVGTLLISTLHRVSRRGRRVFLRGVR